MGLVVSHPEVQIRYQDHCSGRAISGLMCRIHFPHCTLLIIISMSIVLITRMEICPISPCLILRPHSHQAKAKKIKEQVAKIKRIPDKHQRNFSLSLSLGVNRP